MNDHQARLEAAAILKAALQSGTIKLTGNQGRGADNATGDVAYLTALLHGLVDALKKEA